MRNVLIAVVLTLAGVTANADYDAGIAAYEAGDFATALKEFKRLAESNIVLAQTNLGYMYALGEGVEVDLTQSAFWFERAAENGSTAAQFTMGALTYHGEGVEVDPVKSYAWFSLASAGGQAGADDYITLLTTLLTSDQLKRARVLSETLYERFGVKRKVSLSDPG